MSSNQPTIIDPGLLATIRRHLDGLRRSPDGAALYALIERGLRRFAGPDGRIELAFVTFLNSILGKFAKDPVNDPATRVKARLIQQRLMLHLPPAGTAAGSASIPPAAAAAEPLAARAPTPAEPAPLAPDSVPAPTAAAAPDAPSEVAPEAAVATDVPAPVETAIELSPPATAPESAQPPSPAPDAAPAPDSETEPYARALDAPDEGAVGAAPDAAPAVPKESVAVLVDKVTESITFNAEFDSLVQSQEQALERVDGAIRDFKDLKQLIVGGLDDLIREREVLKQQLTHAAAHMKSAEAARAQLQRELSTARKHSVMDDLTNLPKRDAFLRSLEAEIGRVRRYGFALTLAIVDIDSLETVNRQHGRAAGDAVLRCYAAEVLGNFRAYDLVARYDDDAFAVLFPNTQKEGATRALEKARKRAAETYLSHADRHFALPGFSSVLAVYTPGEKAAALLRRADEALDLAKLKGRGQSVFALPSS